MLKHTITFLLLLYSCAIFSQGEANNWYFGNRAGITFNGGGAPTALTDGQLRATEGVATISNQSGDLLFYTNGLEVWNRNHDVMPNGTDLTGNDSSTQSGVIVPHPGDPNLYFLFANKQDNSQPILQGFRYSIVDIRLDGGLGDIVAGQKNILLHDGSSERLTAVQHINGKDIWMIAYSRDQRKYFTYLITETGLDPNAVESPIGMVLGRHTRGYMKASPDGTKLAIAHDAAGNEFELLDFDRTTGIVSNQMPVRESDIDVLNIPSGSGIGHRPYGVEFSPNGEYLYIAFEAGGIYQFDASQTTASGIISTGRKVSRGGGRFKALQLGPDRKIYSVRSGDGTLGVIHNPNSPAAGINYEHNAVDLGGFRTGREGLPNFIQTFFEIDIDARNLCLGDDTEFELNRESIVTSVEWDFGDGSAISTDIRPTHQYAAVGDYTVTATAILGTDTEVYTTTITIYDLPVANAATNLSVCDGSPSDGIADFNLTIKDAEILGSQSDTEYVVRYYINQTDAENAENEITGVFTNTSNPQTIYARIHNRNSFTCHDITTFDLVVSGEATIGALTDFVLCGNNNNAVFDLSEKDTEVLGSQNASDFAISYYESEADAIARRDAIADHTSYTNTSNGQMIYARIESSTDQNCFNTGSFALQVSQEPRIANLTVLTFCGNGNAANFNLRDKDTEILGTQNASDFEITYHNSSDDAMNDANVIANPEAYSAQSSEEIHVRIENATNAACFEIGSFNLMISQTPVIASAPLALDNCGTMGVATFNLRENDDEVLGNQTATEVTITYHTSSDDAMNNVNAIATPENYTSQQDGEEIFVRIENNTNTVCFATDSFILNVFEIPTAGTVTDLELCDANADVINYDLSFSFPEILGTQDASQFDISFYSTQADADARTNELELTQETSEASTAIFARIENIGNTACFQTTSFNILKRESPVLTIADDVFICP
ncbi:PKD domain-containing protein, partial [Aquimarina rhabdastrellae]